LSGAAYGFAIDAEPRRLQMAKAFGATHTFLSSAHPVEMIMAKRMGEP
jgi:Zn-dependent alcohol dehydrogenase